MKRLKHVFARVLRRGQSGRAEPSAPVGSPRTFIAVDMANLAHMLGSVRDKGLDMDYAKLLAWLSQDRTLVMARVYSGLDPDIPSVGGFLRRLQALGYEVLQIQGKTYRDGSVKQPNADSFIITDLLLAADTYDEATLVSGDGDFAYMVKGLLELGKKVRVVSTRSHLAQSLRESGATVEYLEPHLPNLTMMREHGTLRVRR